MLNGGILGTRGVPTTAPTQEELWKQFREAAKLTKLSETLSGLTVTDIAGNNGLQTADQLNGVFDNKWGWLKKYIMDVQNEEAKKGQTFADGNLSRTVATLEENISSGNNLINWRYSVAAFFKNTRRVGYPNATADFSTAGKREAWKDSYETANSNLIPLDPLPETIVGSEFLLPRGKPDYEEITHPSGCNFLGWFDNPDMTGTELTTLPVGYKGTVYAKWDGIITWILNGGKYTGEGTLPTTVDAKYTLPTAADMERVAYVFGGWYEDAAFTGDALTTIEAGYKGVLHAKWIPAYYVTWHPDHCHDVSNEDLWQLFMEDWNAWYKGEYAEKKITETKFDQLITDAYGFTFPADKNADGSVKYPGGLVEEFMTNPKSTWKWLGDYIVKVAEAENNSGNFNSNVPLWIKFKEAAELNIAKPLADCKWVDIGGNDGFPQSEEGAKRIRAVFAKPEWKWLADYIESYDTKNKLNVKPTEVSYNSDPNSSEYKQLQTWRAAIASFFLCMESQYPFSTDFSTLGQYTTWSKWLDERKQNYNVSSEDFKFSLESEIEWRKQVAAFFNASNEVNYSLVNNVEKKEGTLDFRTKGLPKPNGDPAEGWYKPWWDATFPEYMAGGSTLPKVARKGYVFAGWYCGTNEGYYFKPEARMNSVRGYDASNTNGKNHLWARWYELCLYEGYVKKDHHSLIEDEKVNHNVDMLSCANSDETKRSYKMSINRKFLADGVSYSTLVLPFAIPREVYNEETKSGKTAGDYIKLITDENGKYVFDPDKGEGGEMPSILVCEGANKKNVNGEDMVEFVFKELDVTSHSSSGVTEGAIPPYVPFLIKPKQPISARLQFWAAYCYSRGATPMPYVLPNSYVEFYPVLAPSKIEGPESGSSLILVDKNRLAQVYQDGEMLGLRGYFVVKDEWANLPAKITIRENVTTDVEEVVNTDTKVEVQKVMRNNRVYIIREGHTYDILGNKVE